MVDNTRRIEEQELMQLTEAVEAENAGIRVDVFLAGELGFSRANIQKLIDEGNIVFPGKFLRITRCKISASASYFQIYRIVISEILIPFIFFTVRYLFVIYYVFRIFSHFLHIDIIMFFWIIEKIFP